MVWDILGGSFLEDQPGPYGQKMRSHAARDSFFIFAKRSYAARRSFFWTKLRSHAGGVRFSSDRPHLVGFKRYKNNTFGALEAPNVIKNNTFGAPEAPNVIKIIHLELQKLQTS